MVRTGSGFFLGLRAATTAPPGVRPNEPRSGRDGPALPASKGKDDKSAGKDQRCLLLDLLDRDSLDCVLMAAQHGSSSHLLARLGQTCTAFRKLSERVRCDVVLQRLSDGWDPEKPAESLPLPSALCEGGSFLDALTEPSRGQKRVMCYVTRKRGVRASFGFHLQLPPGMGDLQCFSARRHVLGRARGLCYTISLHRTVVAEVWYDADGNFSLVERRGGAAAGAAPPSKASPSKASPKALPSQFVAAKEGDDDGGDDHSGGDPTGGCWPIKAQPLLRPKVLPAAGGKAAVRESDSLAMQVLIRRSRIRPRSVRVKIPAQGQSPHASEFVNLEPRWDDVLKHYVLKYHGRATRASVKNVQLQPADRAVANGTRHPSFDGVAFLVGKVGDDRFNVDFMSPFSFLHAFALSLIIVDSAYFGCI